MGARAEGRPVGEGKHPLGGRVRDRGRSGPNRCRAPGESVALLQPKSAPAVTVTAILAREEHPPTGEKVIEWRLLTNRTAETLEAVVELMDGYRRCWLIEIIFSESSNRVAVSMR